MEVAIPKRIRPFKEDAGPWLIWSYHWNCWHVRSSTGGAAGYTSNLLEAGIFDLRIARAYHNTPPHRRDVSVPFIKAVKAMEHRLAELTAQRDAYAARIEQAKAALTDASERSEELRPLGAKHRDDQPNLPQEQPDGR